jgi:hypothetical protein
VASGRNKRQAEQRAARDALARLKVEVLSGEAPPVRAAGLGVGGPAAQDDEDDEADADADAGD